jgi:iron complex outermembrane recepter protein
VGDPGLDPERALHLAGTVDYAGDRMSASATLYATRFRDFIYQAETGLEDDGLPVRVWTQDDADFWGLDLDARFRVLTDGPLALDARAFYDRVRAELDVSGNDQLPRLPPDRVGAGLVARWQRLTAHVDYLRVMNQNDTAEFELPTRGYHDLRAGLAAQFGGPDSAITVFVEGRNLTDAEQRNHVSYLKDFAPLPGRTLIGGVRATF